MWKTICQPVLLYGSNCINLSSTDIKTMETSQRKMIKQSLGLSKYSRNTNSRIELALIILEPGQNWNINETFGFNILEVSINTKKRLTNVKNREGALSGSFPRWPPSAILEN